MKKKLDVPHFVNDKLNSGKVIIQKFYINQDDNLKNFKQKTQILEHLTYPEAINKIFRYS